MGVKKKDENGYLVITKHNEYVKGIVGADIRLSFAEKLKIMFSKGINVAFIGSDVYNKGNDKYRIPKIDWIPFDKNNPPTNLGYEQTYLILLREDWHRRSNERNWRYHVDVATAYGSYLDDFWNTENDWDEGQLLEVLAYAELPVYLSDEDLVESEEDYS